MRAAAVAALALLWSGAAFAQEDDYDAPPNAYTRPHIWRAEVRLSTVYYPYNIDNGLAPLTLYPNGLGGGAVEETPFSAVFGPKHRLLTEAEFDRDLWQGFGSAGIGLGGAYAEFYGTGFHNAGSNAAPVFVGSGDGTGFHVAQARLLGFYRFDYFVPQGIPVVPFVKVGLDWAYYWEQLSSGKLTPNQSGNGNAQGLVTGVEASLGLSLLVDFIDPVVARDMYRDLYIAHTYVTGSYTWQNYQNGPSDLVHAIFNGGQSASPALNLTTGFFDFGVSVEF
jgi:hypothetical protein